MVNFFGFYLDPVYILILTVFIIAGFMTLFIRQLNKMTDILKKALVEAHYSETTRAANEARDIETRKVLDALEAQSKELKQHMSNYGR